VAVRDDNFAFRSSPAWASRSRERGPFRSPHNAALLLLIGFPLAVGLAIGFLVRRGWALGIAPLLGIAYAALFPPDVDKVALAIIGTVATGIGIVFGIVFGIGFRQRKRKSTPS
jgi:hypothetical protein